MLFYKETTHIDPGVQMEVFNILQTHRDEWEMGGRAPIHVQNPFNVLAGWANVIPNLMAERFLQPRDAAYWDPRLPAGPDHLMHLAGILSRHAFVVQAPNFTVAKQNGLLDMLAQHLPEGRELNELKRATGWMVSRTTRSKRIAFSEHLQVAYSLLPRTSRVAAFSHFRTFHTLEVS